MNASVCAAGWPRAVIVAVVTEEEVGDGGEETEQDILHVLDVEGWGKRRMRKM